MSTRIQVLTISKGHKSSAMLFAPSSSRNKSESLVLQGYLFSRKLAAVSMLLTHRGTKPKDLNVHFYYLKTMWIINKERKTKCFGNYTDF